MQWKCWDFSIICYGQSHILRLVQSILSMRLIEVHPNKDRVKDHITIDPGSDVRLPAGLGGLQPVRAHHRGARSLRDGRRQIAHRWRGQAPHLIFVVSKQEKKLQIIFIVSINENICEGGPGSKYGLLEVVEHGGGQAQVSSERNPEQLSCRHPQLLHCILPGLTYHSALKLPH